MEGFLNRYRNITVLLLVIFAQLLLLAVQVKNKSDVRVIRVWTVTAVTPVARVLEGLRGGSLGFVRNYILLHNANDENRRLREENGRLKMETTFLKNELSRADRAKALELFQTRTPSKMVAATVIATGAGSNSKVVFVDRGSASGVMRGMAVVTPDGIVGKVIAAYPTASEVLLVTDAEFAAGVISQKNQVRGTLKGDGTPVCRVDYVPFEEKVEPGEVFFTSGDDRVFPRGFQVGVVKAVRPGQPFKEVLVEPTGIKHGLDDVLIIVHGVHEELPSGTPTGQPVYIAPSGAPPPAAATEAQTAAPHAPATGTEADKLRAIYKSVGEAQSHTYGEGAPGSKPPDFTKLPATPLAPTANAPGKNPATAPAGGASQPPPQRPPTAQPTGQPATAAPKPAVPAPKTAVPATDPAKRPPPQPNDRPATAPPKPQDPLRKQQSPGAAAAPRTGDHFTNAGFPS